MPEMNGAEVTRRTGPCVAEKLFPVTGWGEDDIVKIVLVRQFNLAFKNREAELLLNLRSL